MTWDDIRLGEIAEFRNGLNYTDAHNGHGLRIIGVSDFADHVIAPHTGLKQLSLDALPSEDALVRKQDILFVRSNGNRELIGRSMFVRDEPSHPTSFSGFSIRCRINREECLPRFYAYLFRGQLIRQALSAYGGGTNISNLNQEILSNLRVPLPPFQSQARIAAYLSAYDDLIENNTRRIAILEEMARLIYEEWFVRFRAPGLEGVAMVESELGMIPERWVVALLEELYSTSSGGTPSRKKSDYYVGTIPWVKTKELLDGPIFQTEENISESALRASSAKLFSRNTVLIAMYGATIGQLGVLTKPAATNQACCAIIPNKGFGWTYAFTTLRARRSEIRKLGQGAAQQNISQAVLRKLPILRPDPSTVAAFERLVEPIYRLFFNLHQQNTNLRTQRDLLLPKLISGEIDVADVPPIAEAAE